MPLSAPGEPARLPFGETGLLPLVLAPMFSFSLCFLRVPSDISPPEPAPPSSSLPEPARGRLLPCEAGGIGGELGRDDGARVGCVTVTWGDWEDFVFFLTFFLERADSLPEASEAIGEPERLRLVEEVAREMG